MSYEMAVTDHANKPFHGLSFFALRDIEKETELTFLRYAYENCGCLDRRLGEAEGFV